MNNKATLLTFILCSLPPVLFASNNPMTNPPTIPTHLLKQGSLAQPSEQEANNSKGNWMRNIEQTLPALLCDSKHYFVSCFEISQQECIDYTHMMVHGCLSQVAVALPEKLDKAQGEHWGQIIGRCSYDLYEKFMQGKKRKTKGCEAIQKPNVVVPKP